MSYRKIMQKSVAMKTTKSLQLATALGRTFVDPQQTYKYDKGWRVDPRAPNSHEYFHEPGNPGDYVIDLTAEPDGWDAYWWDVETNDSAQATISYDVIPEHDVEAARQWALAVWRMS